MVSPVLLFLILKTLAPLLYSKRLCCSNSVLLLCVTHSHYGLACAKSELPTGFENKVCLCG